MYLGSNPFSSFLHHFILAKLTTSSIKVKDIFFVCGFKVEHLILSLFFILKKMELRLIY